MRSKLAQQIKKQAEAQPQNNLNNSKKRDSTNVKNSAFIPQQQLAPQTSQPLKIRSQSPVTPSQLLLKSPQQNSFKDSQLKKDNKWINPLEGYIILQPGEKNNLQVNKLGLALQKVCQIKGHDRNKVEFLCTNVNCAIPRIGCLTCMVEQHRSCQDNKDDIESFLQTIQLKYEKVNFIILQYQYYEQLKRFRTSSKMLETSEYINEIIKEMDTLKTSFNKRIDNAKAAVQQQFEDLMFGENFRFTEIVAQQKEFSYNLEVAYPKMIFDMNQLDLNTLVLLYSDEQIKPIQENINKIAQKDMEVEQQFNIGFQNYKMNLKQELNFLMDQYQKIQLPVKMDDKQLKFYYLLQKRESKKRMLQDYKLIEKELKEIEKEMNQINNSFKNQLCSQVNQEHTHDADNEGFAIPIFECCQQAFKCHKCHDNFCTDHKSVFTSPSKRFCPRCKKVFSVNLQTYTRVQCQDCPQK